MIDIVSYKRAIRRFQQILVDYGKASKDKVMELSILHQFEVLVNVSEGIVRTEYLALGQDEYAPTLSTREVLRRAEMEGITLSTKLHWAEYCVALERTNEQYMQMADVDLSEELLSLLPRLLEELKEFAAVIEHRMVQLG